MKKWTIYGIEEDFENQKFKDKLKFCPLIKEQCTPSCYNYYPSRIHVQAKFPSHPTSRSFISNEMDKMRKDCQYCNEIVFYQFIPQGCLIFDAIAEMSNG